MMGESLSKITDQGAEGGRGRKRMDDDRELRALISLLSDDDQKIVSMVWENLVRLGAPSLPYLDEVAEHRDPRLRLRARHVAEHIRTEQLERQFVAMAAQDEEAFDLEEALCVVARIEHPSLDSGEVKRQLDALAEELRPQIPRVAPPRERVELLNQFLFREKGFQGNTRDYYDPDNSFINKVLERRTGIPITLAAVMILVGRRLDLPLHGLGLPRHFVVKYEDAATEFFVDPFNGGRIFNRKECMQILSSDGYYLRESYAAEYFSTCSPRDIIIRMLRNLVLIYTKIKDKTRQKRLSRYVEILRMRAKAH
jgi:regulator of sirC expression with transglutaminase-like and TPR domain